MVIIFFVCVLVLFVSFQNGISANIPNISEYIVSGLENFGVHEDMYAGFIPLHLAEENNEGNLFFWLVKRREKESNSQRDKKLVVWLNGGPGCSSLFGMITENGPFLIGSPPNPTSFPTIVETEEPTVEPSLAPTLLSLSPTAAVTMKPTTEDLFSIQPSISIDLPNLPTLVDTLSELPTISLPDKPTLDNLLSRSPLPNIPDKPTLVDTFNNFPAGSLPDKPTIDDVLSNSPGLDNGNLLDHRHMDPGDVASRLEEDHYQRILGSYHHIRHVLNYNPYSWNEVGDILYLEQPIRTGFSMATQDTSDVKNEHRVSKDFRLFLISFMKIFDEYDGMPFFITGESYAGTYIPWMAKHILDKKEEEYYRSIYDPTYVDEGNPNINLEGVAIGNGAIDSVTITASYTNYAYAHGLIPLHAKERIDYEWQKCLNDAGGEKNEKNMRREDIDKCNIMGKVLVAAGNPNQYNTNTFIQYNATLLENFMNDPYIQRLLNVRGYDLPGINFIPASFAFMNGTYDDDMEDASRNSRSSDRNQQQSEDGIINFEGKQSKDDKDDKKVEDDKKKEEKVKERDEKKEEKDEEKEEKDKERDEQKEEKDKEKEKEDQKRDKEKEEKDKEKEKEDQERDVQKEDKDKKKETEKEKKDKEKEKEKDKKEKKKEKKDKEKEKKDKKRKETPSPTPSPTEAATAHSSYTGFYAPEKWLSCNNMINDDFQEDHPVSAVEALQDIAGKIRVLLYNGEFDLNCNFIGTQNTLEKHKWLGSPWKHAERSLWKFNGDVAGEHYAIGNFSFLIVRRSGHMVPTDQPEASLDMITRFLYDESFQDIMLPSDDQYHETGPGPNDDRTDDMMMKANYNPDIKDKISLRVVFISFLLVILPSAILYFVLTRHHEANAKRIREEALRRLHKYCHEHDFVPSHAHPTPAIPPSTEPEDSHENNRNGTGIRYNTSTVNHVSSNLSSSFHRVMDLLRSKSGYTPIDDEEKLCEQMNLNHDQFNYQL